MAKMSMGKIKGRNISENGGCICVGVRCGAHPMGRCAKKPVKAYHAGGTADRQSVRYFCEACAKGLGSRAVD